MAQNLVFCLLLMTPSLQHVTSFAVHRRHSRGLADALRMLERQRRRIDNEQNLLASPQYPANEDPAQKADLDSLFQSSAGSSAEEDISPAWMVRNLGPESSHLTADSPDDLQVGEFLEQPVIPQSAEVGPEDQTLESEFEEKSDEDEVQPPPRVDKKDKEVMTNIIGDARPKVRTRSLDSVTDKDPSSVTMKEFDALLQAVEDIEQQALAKAEEEKEEEEEVMHAVEDKIAEAREEAKEEQAEAADMEANPLLAGDDGLDDLFEEQSEEVIPTENGEIVEVDRTLKTSDGEPVGQEQLVEEVQTFPARPDLSATDDLWYIKYYVDEERQRRKRDSMSASLANELPILKQLTSQLLHGYMKKIRQLETDLDQAQMENYLEDEQNDLLTEALDEATLAQLHPGRHSMRELRALRDAIRVEEMLQEVKGDSVPASDVLEEEKRGEPWRKRSDVIYPEVPVYAIGGGSDVMDDVGNDAGDDISALAVTGLSEEDDEENLEDPFVPFSEEDADLGVDRADGDLLGGPRETASLFSDDADQCPAVQAYSTNCPFGSPHMDYEARALCNLHEMCYVCGTTLEMKALECDFIYREASAVLCDGDGQCALESELFLNLMKLKHRFVPYRQPFCRSRCTARFLSLV